MTKAPLGGELSGPNPTDRAKQGTKRSLLWEGAGVPISLEVAGANVNDFKLLARTIASIPITRPQPTEDRPHGLCLDKGYDFREVYELVVGADLVSGHAGFYYLIPSASREGG